MLPKCYYLQSSRESFRDNKIVYRTKINFITSVVNYYARFPLLIPLSFYLAGNKKTIAIARSHFLNHAHNSYLL